MKTHSSTEKTLIVFGSPPLPADVVRKVIKNHPAIEYDVLGSGLTANYLRDAGLEGADVIGEGGDWKTRLLLIRSIRKKRPASAVYIGVMADLIGPLTAALSGAGQRLASHPFAPGTSSPRPIRLLPLLLGIAGRLILFLAAVPAFLILRVLLARSGIRRGEISGESIPAPVTGAQSPPVSLVVPNFNGRELLKLCIPSLERALDAYPGGGEIVVVDDASSDGSAEWVKKAHTSVQVIAFPENRGFARASNRGIAEAKNRVVILLNSDIIVAPDFIGPLVEHLRDPDLFAVQPRLDTWKGDGLDLGLSMGHMENGYIRIWNEKETGNPRYIDYPASNLYAVGGAMAFDKEKWDRLGGFDEIYYPFCWEDIDVSYRAWKRGWKVLYEPKSRVRHLHYGTISRFFAPEYKRVIEQKNELLFIWKNIHSPRLWKSHLANLPRLLLSALLTGNLAFYRAFWKALAEIGAAGRERKREIGSGRVTDEVVFSRSLLPYRNWVKRGFRERDPGEKLQVLIITNVIPYPPNDGGKIRLYQILKNLGGRYDIHFVSFYYHENELHQLDEIRGFCRYVDVVRFIPRPLNLSQRIFCPEFCQSWITPEMVNLIGEIVRTRPIDLVQIDLTLMAYCQRLVDDIPTIFVELDAGILKFGQSYNPARRGWKKPLELYEWLRMLEFELDFLPAFTKVITLSDDDEKLLKSFLPDLDISTVTMGTDLDHFLEPYRPVDNHRILYVGSLGHYPNVDAVRWFVSAILPEIRRTIPDATMTIVGSGDPASIADMRERAGVEYIGPVEDVRPYLREAAVFVAPVRLGSGMKGKVLEALAMAKPMVATSVAAGGIPVVSGEHLIIADDPQSFADGVIRLFRDPDLREKVARNGQDLVRENFGWKKKADEMDQIYQQILAETRL